MNNSRYKFRVWDSTTKKMVNENLSSSPSSGAILPSWEILKLYSENIMQFTGLYDKNGKEIYEGDIIKYGFWLEVVEFKDGAFRLFPSKLLLGRLNVYKNCVVIGDKYKNEELLKKIKKRIKI